MEGKTMIACLVGEDGRAMANAVVEMGIPWHTLIVYGRMICRTRANSRGGVDFVRLYNGEYEASQVTMRRINAFRAMYGLPKISKAEWDGMESGRAYV